MRRNSGRWLAVTAVVLIGAATPVVTATAAAAAAGPAIAVYPTTPLADGQRVTVLGRGFDPARPVTVQECTGESYGCVDRPFTGSVHADGWVLLRTRVERALPYDGGPNDCAVYHCGLQVSQPNGPTAFTGLHFAPGRVTVTPDTGVREGQTVTVVGTNLVPGQTVGLGECQEYALLCTERLDAAGPTVVGPDGTVRLRTRPTRFLPDYMDRDELYDCAVSACFIGINLYSNVWEDGYETVAWAQVPFAPIPKVGAAPEATYEGTTGTTPVRVKFTDAVGSTVPRTVQYRTLPGTAGPDDFVPVTGTVVVPAGATSGEVTVSGATPCPSRTSTSSSSSANSHRHGAGRPSSRW